MRGIVSGPKFMKMLTPEVRPDPLVASRRSYQRPPVLEALVSLNIDPPVPVEKLRALHDAEVEKYPVRETLMSAELRVDPTTNAVVKATEELDGYRLPGTNARQVAHFRRRGFSFSQLAPYQGWEVWRDEAKRLWKRYREAAPEGQVTRIGVRYVNRIDITPSAGRRLRDYLAVSPSIPGELPQLMSTFLMRLEMKVPDIDSSVVIINVGRTESPDPGKVSVLLDLDLICTRELAVSEPQVWQFVEQLHEIENRYFEASITDLAREMFI